MRHKWILLMCAGVILMLVTIANPVEGYPTKDDDSGAQTSRNQNENGTHANNETDVESFSTTEASHSGTIIEHTTTPRVGKAVPMVGTQKPSFVCTKSGLNYDCIFNNIKLGQNETQNFGLSWKNNPEKNVTFEDSRLAYLPKKLIEAFPQMESLNAEDLQMEQIEERAFSKAANLKYLYLQKNRFTTINGFIGAPELVHLDLSNNRINQINEDAFKNNKMLKRMLLNNNLISELPNTNEVENLQILNAANNEINEIHDDQFSRNNKLEKLDISFNKLDYFNLVHLDDKPNLSSIDVSHNKLESLYIPTKARVFKAANNSIHVISVNECKVERLDLSRNQITDVTALQKCRELINLDLSHNSLQSFNLIKSYPKLSNLNLAQNQLFEIDFPPYFHQLQTLDLSYNHLSFGPANKFTQMKNMKLNNNKFIEFKFATMNQLNYLQMNNNEWDCDRIKDIIKAKAEYVTDTTGVCHGRKSQNGICCKDYKRAFNDRLIEIIRETFIHKNVNRKDEQTCKPAESVSQGMGKQEIQKLHANTATLDSASKKIFDRIEQTKIKYDDIVNQITADQSKKSELKEKLKNYKRIVHKLREHYGVINEGLISTNLTLNRVLQFTQERNILSKDLLARRVQEVQQTDTRFNSLMDTINAANNLNAKLKEDLTILKTKESSAKKERQQLEKAWNKNSPSLNGSRG